MKTFEHWIRVSGDLDTLLRGGFDERIAAIAAICKKLAPIEAAHIHWFRDRGKPPAGGTGSTESVPFPNQDEISAESPFDEWVAQVATTGRPFYSMRNGKDTNADRDLDDRHPPTGSWYLLPLGITERMLGVLSVETTDTGGIPGEVRYLLDRLAPTFALAIENSRRHGVGTSRNSGATGRPQVAPYAVDAITRTAHDIKNSMTSVSTFMQLLSTKWHDTAFRSSFYPVAREETMRVTRLVNDLLNYGKSSSRHRLTVDLRAVLTRLVARQTPVAEQRRQHLRIHDQLTCSTIRIDKKAVEEALVNLLCNAIEASPDGGRIDIDLRDDVLASGQPAIRIAIQDSGPGIDKALQEAIFAPYMSTKSGDLSSGGTGLGLSIARRHIEAHGGTITAARSARGGALFRVLLPLERRRG